MVNITGCANSVFTVAQKSKPLPIDQKIVLNRIKACQWDKIYKLNYRMNHALYVGIRYSMRDLLSDLNNYAWPAN